MSTQRYIPEDTKLHTHCRENPKSQMKWTARVECEHYVQNCKINVAKWKGKNTNFLHGASGFFRAAPVVHRFLLAVM
jgi:hypothetical protein